MYRSEHDELNHGEILTPHSSDRQTDTRSNLRTRDCSRTGDDSNRIFRNPHLWRKLWTE